MERFQIKMSVGLLLIKDRKILLIKRCNTGYMDDMYALVSGHVEAGEGLKQAVAREALEEVGITIPLDKIDYVTMIRDGENDPNFINFYLTARDYFGVPENKETDKCSELGWFDIDNLPSNMIPADRRAIDNYYNDVSFDEINFSGYNGSFKRGNH